MARDDRRMTFIVVPHGRDPSTRSFELSYGKLKTLAVAGAVLAVLVVLMAGSWLWLATQAGRVPGLSAEVKQLRRDRVRVEELARTVEQLNLEYAKVRSMLGADSTALPAIVDSAGPAAEAADSTADDSAGARPRRRAPPSPRSGRWRRGGT
jgi:hypothetical protein